MLILYYKSISAFSDLDFEIIYPLSFIHCSEGETKSAHVSMERVSFTKVLVCNAAKNVIQQHSRGQAGGR